MNVGDGVGSDVEVDSTGLGVRTTDVELIASVELENWTELLRDGTEDEAVSEDWTPGKQDLWYKMM